MKIEEMKTIAEKACDKSLGPRATYDSLLAFEHTFTHARVLKLLKVVEAADNLCNGQPGYGHVYAAHEAQVERIKALGLALRELEESE